MHSMHKPSVSVSVTVFRRGFTGFKLMNSKCLFRQEISLYSRLVLIFGSAFLCKCLCLCIDSFCMVNHEAWVTSPRSHAYVCKKHCIGYFFSKLILPLTWTTLMLQRRERGRVMMISSTEIAVSSTAQMSGPSLHKAGILSKYFHLEHHPIYYCHTFILFNILAAL